jgi:uncharacterized membrane protein YeaQ/YmgE (transglycosylase-associated protein family)
MESVFEVLGATALVLLVVIGAVAGIIAGKIAGQSMALYVVVGIVAAVAAPFILATLGVGVLAAGGLLLILAVSAVFAVIVLALVRAVLK